MHVYPGDPQPKFKPHLTINDDSVNVTRLVLGSHTGTHVDAPWHFLRDGRGVDKEPLAKFIGEAVVADISAKPGKGAKADDLDIHAGIVQHGDILLLYTGTSDHCTGFTYLDVSAAEWAVDKGVKCIGMDTPSVEKFGARKAPVHKTLLSHDIGIIENLINLREFVNLRMFLVCLPLPLDGIDGSPARAILFEIVK
jgi:kynurenine formamidase